MLENSEDVPVTDKYVATWRIFEVDNVVKD